MNATQVSAANPIQDRAHRYRQAEQIYWDHYGLAPKEHQVMAGSPPTQLRVQEVGSGTPILFVHGTGGSGAYFAPLVRELQDFRCLVLDRPGWGLSSPFDFAGGVYKTVVAELLGDTLDALGVDQVQVVAGSIGNLWALRLAQAQPARVQRLVLLGAGPLTSEIGVPPFIRLLRSPVGQLMIRMPENPRMLRRQLAGLGHAASLEAGRIPDAFIDWHVAMSRQTDWAKHERHMVRNIVRSGGYVPGLVLDDAEVAGIRQPTLMVYGTADPIGSVDIWARFVRQMPQAEIELVKGGGHLVWYDDAVGIGGRVRRFLAA